MIFSQWRNFAIKTLQLWLIVVNTTLHLVRKNNLLLDQPYFIQLETDSSICQF